MEVGVSVKDTSANTTKLNDSNGLLKANSVKILYNYLYSRQIHSNLVCLHPGPKSPWSIRATLQL